MSDTPPPVDPEPHEDDPVTVADKPREPSEYERRLRREATNARAKLRAAEADRDAAKQGTMAAEAKALSDVEAARKDANTAAEARIVRAELKAAALAAGMVDADGLKLLDLSAVKLGDDGEVAIPEGFFAAAKLAKPFLFGQPSTTSTTQRPPAATPPAAKSATEMTTEEWRAARAEAVKRRA